VLWDLGTGKSYFQVGVLKFKGPLKIFKNGGYIFKNGGYIFKNGAYISESGGIQEVLTKASCSLFGHSQRSKTGPRS
jgi:hypothetical protein